MARVLAHMEHAPRFLLHGQVRSKKAHEVNEAKLYMILHVNPCF